MADSKSSSKKGYIAIARCSTNAQADSSTDDQLRVIRACPELAGRPEVATYRLEGVSASNPETMDRIIDEIIERKRTLNDFGKVAFQDSSRLTRCGPAHGGYIRYRLDRDGIDVVCISSPNVDPAIAPILQAIE